MSETPVTRTRYRYVPYGGSVEEHDRFAIAQKIRHGDIDGSTQLAVVGSDLWKAAASYPELARYFELAAARPAASAVYAAAPAKPRTVESMGDRIVRGLGYPIAGGHVATVIVLAILSIFPFISIFATLTSTVIALDVVRKSADGRTKMPAWIETSTVWEMVRLYLRVLFVTLVSLAPLIIVGGWALMGMVRGAVSLAFFALVLLAAAAFAAIYYPACLATVAVWDNVISALSPAYVFRVIGIIGGDYFIVVAMWFIASALSGFLRLFSPLSLIPIVGGAFSAFLSLYVLFYASHLLGYAVYRHAPELGWE